MGIDKNKLLREMRENTALHTDLTVEAMERMNSDDWHNFRMAKRARTEEF